MRRIKSISYIPLIPTFSLKGEGAFTCVDTFVARKGDLFGGIPAASQF